MKPSSNNTVALPRPEDFPLGSPQSRAAARLLAANRHDTRKRIEIVSHVPRPWAGEGLPPLTWNRVPSADPWKETRDGRLSRTVYIPTDWEKAPWEGEPPLCPECGTPYRREERYGGWLLFQADCLEKHVPEHPNLDVRFTLRPIPPHAR